MFKTAAMRPAIHSESSPSSSSLKVGPSVCSAPAYRTFLSSLVDAGLAERTRGGGGAANGVVRRAEWSETLKEAGWD